MELLLVRHAQPHLVDHDPEGADPALTADGRRQADLLAKYLSAHPFGEVTRLASSTMVRARQTAEPLATALGLESELDERLVEVDAGWTQYGTSIASYPSRRAGWSDLNEGRFGPNTFDLAKFRARIVAGIEDVISRTDADSSAVIVCHGGVITAYLAHVLGMSRTFFIDPAYTSLTRVHADTEGYRELISVNETTHLTR